MTRHYAELLPALIAREHFANLLPFFKMIALFRCINCFNSYWARCCLLTALVQQDIMYIDYIL